MTTRIGAAGWSIPALSRAAFGDGASGLERYATRFSCVEINSTFYRPHRAATYARWAASVPSDFRFALKMPKLVTHERKLRDVTDDVDRFLAESASLGEKRGIVLVQLPPKHAFDEATTCAFFTMLRDRFAGDIVCEPRHASWFAPVVDATLRDLGVVRVAADPAPEGGSVPGGSRHLHYVRLHGSPRRYYDDYGLERLEAYAAAIEPRIPTWVIFDNTAAGAATADALTLASLLAAHHRRGDLRTPTASVGVPQRR